MLFQSVVIVLFISVQAGVVFPLAVVAAMSGITR